MTTEAETVERWLISLKGGALRRVRVQVGPSRVYVEGNPYSLTPEEGVRSYAASRGWDVVSASKI